MKNRLTKGRLALQIPKKRDYVSLFKPIVKKNEALASILSIDKNNSKSKLSIPDAISAITFNVNGVKYHVNNNHKDNNVAFMRSVSRIKKR